MDTKDPLLLALASFYRKMDEELAQLSELNSDILTCQQGCADCCVDNIKVFRLEADNIGAHYADLIASGSAHPEGACAFLGTNRSCRIYPQRPYVCRMQGLPFKWTEWNESGELVEWRDICPLNKPEQGLDMLETDRCLLPAPHWERLAAFQQAVTGNNDRVSLREIFKKMPG